MSLHKISSTAPLAWSQNWICWKKAPQIFLLQPPWFGIWIYFKAPSNLYESPFKLDFFRSPLDLESKVLRQVPGIQYAHPTILYVVRKVKLNDDDDDDDIQQLEYAIPALSDFWEKHSKNKWNQKNLIKKSEKNTEKTLKKSCPCHKKCPWR